MAVDFESIGKLAPDERVARLKELEAELKKLFDAVKQDLSGVQVALREAVREQEVALERVVGSRAVKRDEKKEESVLEKKAEEHVPSPDELHERLHRENVEVIYQRLNKVFYDTHVNDRPRTQYQENLVEAARRELYERREAASDSDKEKSDAKLSAAERLVQYLRG